MDTVRTKSQRPAWTFTFFLTLSLFTLFAFSNYANAAEMDGAKLFKANCAVCHSLGTNKIVGPGLQGITSKVPQPYEKWMLKWIKNNAALRKSGDAYAKKIYAENNKVAMTVFQGQLSDDQIKSIISFLKNPPKPQTAAAASTSAGGTATGGAKKQQGVNPLFILLGLIAFLIILIAVLRGVKKSLRHVVEEKKGAPITPDLGFWAATKEWMRGHKRIVALIVIFLVAVGSVDSWEYMWGIGVYQGYKPSQPIAFSHKIHAGDNGINCLYCHSGAEKGKVAGIPTLNVCMNCHKGITKGPTPALTKEIHKIYYHVGWDPKTGQYDKPKHPIHWNRVHSLPDFVYFNHAQHVIVGKRKCQTCHGPVQTFTVDHQYAPLTMGWCVNCHRHTAVQMAGNPYYEQIHKKLEEKYKGKKITVADMGGIECGRCHY